MAEIKKQELSDEELEDVSGGNIFDFFNDLFRNKVTNNNGGTNTSNPNSSCSSFEQDPIKPSRAVCNNCKHFVLKNNKFECDMKQQSQEVSNII